jgi:hypothetical protein
MIPVDMDKPVQRVSVMHKVPRSILNVMQSQFEVMNDWMKPILETSEDNSATLEQLQQSVDDCLANYTELLAELKDAGDVRQRVKKAPARKPPGGKAQTAARKPATRKKPPAAKKPPPLKKPPAARKPPKPPPAGSDS